jgi:WXG100 family type VII secretion target
MTDEIKMEYDLMDEMARTFKDGAEKLQDTMSEMLNVAGILEDGALLGDAGAAFTDGIRSKLVPAIQKLVAKFQEMERDIQENVKLMREADEQKSARLF